MHILLAVLSVFSCAAWAANPNPADLQKLVARAIASGNSLSLGDGSEWHILSSVVPNDTKLSHQADYFSVAGYRDSKGHYVPASLKVVAESWQLSVAGGFVIDQWDYSLSLQGDLMAVQHTRLTEDAQDEITAMDPIPANATDNVVLQALDAQLSQWCRGN